MLDNELFKNITRNLIHEDTVEQYYQKLVNFVKTKTNHPDLSTAVDQKTWLEQNYGYKQPDPPKTEILPSYPDVDFFKATDKITKTIDRVIDRDFTAAELQPVIKYIAPELNWSEQALEKYHNLRKEQREEEEFAADIESELTELLQISNSDIKLNQILPDWVAQPLTSYCNNTQTRQSIALITFLTACSVCHKIGTKILVDYSKSWLQPPGLFSLIVSPTGQGKSPIVDALIQEPLSAIQGDWKQAYNQHNEAYYSELAEIKAMPKEEQPGAMKELSSPPDREKILFSTDPTIIGLNLQFNTYPEQGILGVYDEASKLFAFDRTASGKSDRADLLSYYNGGGVTELRKEGIRSNVQQTLFSILGAIQPELLLELMSGCEDPSGQWARFMICNQPLQRKLPSRNKPMIEIKDFLIDIYQKILNKPKAQYLLSEGAANLFDDYLYFEVENKRMLTNQPGLAALYGKVGGKVARLALNLHVIEMLQSPRIDNLIVDTLTMEKAIALNHFFTNQSKALYAISMANQGELPAKLAMIVSRSKQVGPLTARDVQRFIKAFRKDDSSQIRAWFKRLERIGKGRCNGTGNRLTFNAVM